MSIWWSKRQGIPRWYPSIVNFKVWLRYFLKKINRTATKRFDLFIFKGSVDRLVRLFPYLITFIDIVWNIPEMMQSFISGDNWYFVRLRCFIVYANLIENNSKGQFVPIASWCIMSRMSVVCRRCGRKESNFPVLFENWLKLVKYQILSFYIQRLGLFLLT